MIKNIVAIWILATALIGSGCNTNKDNGDTHDGFVITDSLLKTLQIDTVAKCPMVSALTFTGKVSFNDENVARIYPLVSGNISDIKVQLGDYVEKGQTLGIIRSTEMAGYANDLATARANVISAKKNLDVSETMFKSGLVAEQDVVNARSQYDQAQSQLTRATHVLEINGGNTQSEYYLKAPESGFVVDKQVTSNMTIRTDNTNSLFTISDLKNVWIWANVYESNISSVHMSDEVEVTTLAYPDKKFRGKVDKIMNVLDPANKVMKIRVVLPNPQFLLKPEMFAGITVANKTNEQSLCIPSASLVFDHSQYYVLLYKSQSDVKIIPVEMLSKYGNKIYIKGNVQEGDKVISSNVVLIYQALNG